MEKLESFYIKHICFMNTCYLLFLRAAFFCWQRGSSAVAQLEVDVTE